MKSVLIISSLVSTLLFTGCASNKGIALNTKNASMQQEFQTGVVISSKKVLLDDSDYLTTMGGGALGGAAIGGLIGSEKTSKNAGKGALIGAAVGALAGGAYNKATEEKEAYEIIVETKNGSTFTTHVEENIQVGQEMQFIVRSDGTITNLDKKNRKFAN